MQFSTKYKPLFDLLRIDDELNNPASPEGLKYWEDLNLVDTVIMTGGRGSAKSKAVADFVADAVVENDWRVLYTRFTKESLEDSVIAEVKEAFESVGYAGYIEKTGNRIKSKVGEGYISFKGIRPGSGTQSANLKSLKNFNLQVTEEAEEIPDKETDQKIFFSIRSADKRNISIKILNPTEDTHWIFLEYFEKRGVEAGFNGVKGNVLYIHTSVLDVPREFVAENILREYNRMKLEEPEEYEKIVLGGWTTAPKGALFIKKDLKYFSLEDFKEDLVESVIAYVDVADQGADYLAAVVGKVIGKNIYITDVVFSKDNTDITLPQVGYLLRENNAQFCQVESNAAGAKFSRDLVYEAPNTQIIPIHNSTNKNTRIISQYGFIKKYFYFRNDYEYGSEYDLFMRQIIKWKKEERNQPDDAPDALSGLSNFINKFLAHLYNS